MLARKDIDAVEVATPDHWHAIPVIAACKAGKDIYCQKPLSLTIAEGRAMCNAVKRYRRVFQTGSQQRSDVYFRRAASSFATAASANCSRSSADCPADGPTTPARAIARSPKRRPTDSTTISGSDRLPTAPYAPARCHVNFRWIYDYSGGQVTDWGGHHPDCAQWGMGTEATGPIEIVNAKAEFPPDELWNTATEYYFEALYKNGVKLIVTNSVRGGVTFEGTEGWVWADRGNHDAHPKSILRSKIGPQEIHLYESQNHFRNFIDCVISRKETAAPVETAHRSITIGHLGNIAMRLHRKSLKWNPDTEQILGDDEAAKMLSPPLSFAVDAGCVIVQDRPPWLAGCQARPAGPKIRNASQSSLLSGMHHAVEDQDCRNAHQRQNSQEQEHPFITLGLVDIGPDPRVRHGGNDIGDHADDTGHQADALERQVLLASRVTGDDRRQPHARQGQHGGRKEGVSHVRHQRDGRDHAGHGDHHAASGRAKRPAAARQDP